MPWMVSEIPNVRMLFLNKLARSDQLLDLTKGTTVSEPPLRNIFFIFMRQKPCDYKAFAQIPFVLTHNAHLPIYLISVLNQVKTQVSGCWILRTAINKVSLIFQIVTKNKNKQNVYLYIIMPYIFKFLINLYEYGCFASM